jgi:DNA polymerase beta
MKQFFERANKLIQELIDLRYKQSNLFVKLEKNKDSTATQFKIKNYTKWKSILSTHITQNTQIKNINDIKNLKLTEKLELKLCELFDTGDIKDIDDAKFELFELEKQYNIKYPSNSNYNSLSNSIVSIDSSIDDEDEGLKNSKPDSTIETLLVNVSSASIPIAKLKKIKIEHKYPNTEPKETKINTTMLESIPKIMESITRPTDKKGGSIYDLQLLHGIGEKSASILYEKGVTLEGLLSEWTQWISKDITNSILLPQKMDRPREYTQSKWNSLETWNKYSILETNLKKKIDSETIQLSKIHKATLVGLKYFHDIRQKIPREEIQKADTILKHVAAHMNKDIQVILCGSYRRERDKSGDIDCCIVHPSIKTQEDIKNSSTNILANFVEMLINVGFIIDQLDMGLQKFMGLCMVKQNNKKTNVARRLDIRFMPYESYGSALLYFTGSANFNTNIRKIALSKGYSLSEFGFKKKSDGILIPCATEEEVFKFLDYPYKTPKERDI